MEHDGKRARGQRAVSPALPHLFTFTLHRGNAALLRPLSAPQIRTCELLPWFSRALWDFCRHSLKRPAGEGTNRNKPASERPRLECHQGLN